MAGPICYFGFRILDAGFVQFQFLRISIPTSASAPTREPGAVPHRNIFVTSASPHPLVAALPIAVSIPIHIDTSSLRSSRVSGSLRQLLLLPERRSQGHGAYLHRKTGPPYLPRHPSHSTHKAIHRTHE